MKRLIRSINSTTLVEDKPVFSPTEVVRILKQIGELKKSIIGLKEDYDGALILIVDEAEYRISDISGNEVAMS